MNILEEAKELAEMVKSKVASYDINKQAKLVLDLISESETEKDNCISKQAAQNKIKRICNKYGLSYEDGERKPATGGSAYALGHAFDDLPPVIPQQEIGQWIEMNTNEYTCSKCSHCFTLVPEDNHISQFKYCPNCRTKMENLEANNKEDYHNNDGWCSTCEFKYLESECCNCAIYDEYDNLITLSNYKKEGEVE